MNVTMKKEDFESLPFRDDEKGDYVREKFYRALAYPQSVFLWVGGRGGEPAEWQSYSVTLLK